MSFGVVLGGGGPLGAAWYGGLGQGLVDAGFDLAGVDIFIGTSAGAVAAAWWASDQPPAKLADAVVRRFREADVGRGVDSSPASLELLGRIYGHLGEATAPLDAPASRLICELASSVQPRDGDEDWNVNALAAYVPRDWPARFRAVVVRACDGEVRLLGPADSISLARGVAASAAAPGLVSPVRIGTDLYFDGGARSPTNADLATAFGLDRCLVVSAVAPDAPLMGPASVRVLRQEVRRLRGHGTAVALIEPGDLEATAFGSNPMDRSRLHDAIAAGVDRGRREGGTLTYE